MWLIDSSGWRRCYRAKEPNSNPWQRRPFRASQFLTTDRVDSSQQACENSPENSEEQEEDATGCVLHRRSVDRQPGAQPRRDQPATPPLSQGLQELTEGTRRSQRRELQPACLHLPGSRGAEPVPPAERAQGERALQEEAGEAVP